MANYFSDSELRCSHCGENKMQPEFLAQLNKLRETWGKLLILTSAYRCPAHNAAVGGVPGSMHVKGRAVDIAWGTWAKEAQYSFTLLASTQFNGIGINPQFLHVDNRKKPARWSY